MSPASVTLADEGLWTRSANLPTARIWFSASAVNGTIYAVGGGPSATAPYLSTVEAYDPSTDTWTRKANMPTARDGHAASVVSGKIYVIGGEPVAQASLATVEEYDPATDVWTRKADMPTQRTFSCACTVDGKVYVLGGVTAGVPGAEFEPVGLDVYDPTTDTWTVRPDMPAPRHMHAASEVDGKIFVIGGTQQWYPGPAISTVEEYDLNPPPPDFNGDGKIDGVDLLIMTAHWGQACPFCDLGPIPFGDGVVDLQDVIVFAGYIGKEVNDPTLVAHWPLDDVAGIIAHDSAGDNHATLIGTATWQPNAGQVGGALELDGTYFAVADAALNPAEGPFSVLVWAKGGAPSQTILSQQAGYDWLLLDSVTGALMTELRSGGRQSKVLCSNVAITDGAWHRIGFTWNGTNRRLYVDDILVAEDTDVALAACNGRLNIGCGKLMAPGTFFTGLIDDVRIYDRAVKP